MKLIYEMQEVHRQDIEIGGYKYTAFVAKNPTIDKRDDRKFIRVVILKDGELIAVGGGFYEIDNMEQQIQDFMEEYVAMNKKPFWL